MWRRVWNILSTFIVIVAFGFILVKFVIFQQVTVVGQSMQPNYQDGQLLLIHQLDKSLERGNVVAVYEDENVAEGANYLTRFQARFFLKRIIGLPGEEIEIAGGYVIIYNDENPEGKLLVESYIPAGVIASENRRQYYLPRTRIPANEYFVLGDNRSNSSDSRRYGSFQEFAIFGKESFRFWPSNDFQVFDLPSYNFVDVPSEINLLREELKENNGDNIPEFLNN